MKEKPTPRKPTQARPGSDEKIEVLAERYRRGLGLWHDEDRTLTDTGDDESEPTPVDEPDFEDDDD